MKLNPVIPTIAVAGVLFTGVSSASVVPSSSQTSGSGSGTLAIPHQADAVEHSNSGFQDLDTSTAAASPALVKRSPAKKSTSGGKGSSSSSSDESKLEEVVELAANASASEDQESSAGTSVRGGNHAATSLGFAAVVAVGVHVLSGGM